MIFMLNKKIRNTTLGALITLFLLWCGLWLYYQIAMQLNESSSNGNVGPDTRQGIIAKYLQDDMVRYRSIHGTYPNIGEKCQDILVLKPYLTGITTGKYPNYLYNLPNQWLFTSLYPEENILLHPQSLWKFSVSVKSDGSAYVFRVEDRNDTLTGIMHFVARYIVWADPSNEKMFSLKYIPKFGEDNIPLSGTQLGCDCTGKNYCVGDKNTVQSQLK